MSTLTNLPVVNDESVFSKNSRMCLVIAIITLLLLYVCSQKKDLNLTTYNRCIEHMSDSLVDSLDVVMYDTSPIIGKYIQVINNNKKILPIHKIVIIDANKKVIPIFTKDAKITNIGSGVLIEYELLKPTNISQIIIDVNLLDARSENIVNSQVKVRDSQYNVIWTNNDRLFLSRYIELNIKDPKYIYPIKQAVLNNDETTDEQESRLTGMLLENTWS